MRCVILQPSYIPWRGYFHQISRADIFVFYDDVKYDKNGWRNRNRIKSPGGAQWLTIPVLTPELETRQTPIDEIRIDWSRNWIRKHWNSLETSYNKAPYFSKYRPILEPYYHSHPEFLVDFTIPLTIQLSHELGIHNSEFIRSSSLTGITGKKTDRLIQILTQLRATEYLTGPAARDYIDEAEFRAHGIHLEYMAYNYLDYEQLYPPYDPQVSILDLMFMTGSQAINHIIS
jgi:hypothetical protein